MKLHPTMRLIAGFAMLLWIVGHATGALKPNTTLYFPVVQECEQGVSRWIDIPADPAHAHDSKWPAPGVKLIPKP